jgi:uncharacterized protein
MEQGVSFLSAGLRLAGTLATPVGAGPFPVVLLLPGSGQVDRDDNHRRLPIAVLRVLADRLAAAGIGSMRFDKRGVGESEGDYWSTGFYDHVADAERALEFLATLPQVVASRSFVLGHSEGAYIAVNLAAGGKNIAGAVLLAGGARSGEEELRWQARQVVDGLTGFNAFLIKALHIDALKSQAKQLDKIKRSSKDSYRVQLIQRINAKWMREFLAYDPAEDLRRIRVPVLAITGSKDIQVAPSNLETMAALMTAPFESHVVPDVTHLLRSVSGPGGLSTYKAQARRPVDERVLSLVQVWLERHVADAGGIGTAEETTGTEGL